MRILASLAALVALMPSSSAAAAPGDSSPTSAGVAFTRAGEVAAFAVGYADPATGRRLSPDDPVRIASVSKLVVAIGVMKLVEAGKLDLDADVSRYLGWQLRNPAFPDRPITLRQLMSHTSSLGEHDDNYVIPLGTTLRQVVENDPLTWDRAHAPGTWFHYVNLNFGVVGTIVERVTGERFDRWIHAAVLAPMTLDACFNWPTCSDAAIARAVVLTRGGKPAKDDLGGKQPDCPVSAPDGAPCDLAAYRPGDNGALFSPQGGLRISMRGLARVGRMLLNGGEIDGVRILSPKSVALLATPVFDAAARLGGDAQRLYCRYGLATQILGSGSPACADNPLGDGVPWIGHAGEAYALRSGLWFDPKSGRGVAYFVTEQPDSTVEDASFTPAEAGAFRRTVGLLPPR